MPVVRAARALRLTQCCARSHFRDKFYRSGDKLEENCKVRTYNFSGTSVVLHLIMEWLYTGAIGGARLAASRQSGAHLTRRSLAELEASGGFIDDQRVQLWVQLLKESVNKQLGGLDLYVRALLVRSSTTQHHVEASLLSLALQQEEPMMVRCVAGARMCRRANISQMLIFKRAGRGAGDGPGAAEAAVCG